MTTAIHAHRCEACAANGKQVFWIHGDSCKGILQAHKCPECGTVEWKKALIEPGRLPQPKKQESGFNADILLGYIVLLAGLALIGYGIYFYLSKRKQDGLANLPITGKP